MANDDLTDLPSELIAELSRPLRGDPIVGIMHSRGGLASLDQILVDLYRKYGLIGKRPVIANRVYRLSRAGLCEKVSKAVYRLTEAGMTAATRPAQAKTYVLEEMIERITPENMPGNDDTCDAHR